MWNVPVSDLLGSQPWLIPHTFKRWLSRIILSELSIIILYTFWIFSSVVTIFDRGSRRSLSRDVLPPYLSFLDSWKRSSIFIFNSNQLWTGTDICFCNMFANFTQQKLYYSNAISVLGSGLFTLLSIYGNFFTVIDEYIVGGDYIDLLSLGSL